MALAESYTLADDQFERLTALHSHLPLAVDTCVKHSVWLVVPAKLDGAGESVAIGHCGSAGDTGIALGAEDTGAWAGASAGSGRAFVRGDLVRHGGRMLGGCFLL